MADIILIVFIALYAYIGLKNGFIKSVVNFASTLLSFLLTSLLYRPVSLLLYNIGLGSIAKEISLNLLEGKSGENMPPALLDKTADAFSVVIVNIISFVLVIIVIKIALGIITKSLNLVAKLPIIRQANSLLGLLIGFITGLLISYIVIGIIAALGDNETVNIIHSHIKNSCFTFALYENNMVTELLSSVLSN